MFRPGHRKVEAAGSSANLGKGAMGLSDEGLDGHPLSVRKLFRCRRSFLRGHHDDLDLVVGGGEPGFAAGARGRVGRIDPFPKRMKTVEDQADIGVIGTPVSRLITLSIISVEGMFSSFYSRHRPAIVFPNEEHV